MSVQFDQQGLGSKASGGSATGQAGNGASTRGPTSFGRGWIPVERDIGLPDDDCTDLREWASAGPPLQGSGSGGGGSAPRASLGGESRHADPSAGGEGLSVAAHHNSWTPARKAAFLHHLAEKGNVRSAAARVGLSHQSAYVARRRDRAFRLGWEAALVLAREAAAQVLATRALDGIEEPVWFRGENVGTRVRHDSRLLLAHLARLDKAAEETDAGAHAERFDELLAGIAGEQPGEALVDTGEGWAESAPLVPQPREAWAERTATARMRDDYEDWEAEVAAGTASEEDEPSPLMTEWFDAALAEWDTWHARACGAVDAAVAEQSLPAPRYSFPAIEIDMAAFHAADDDELDDEAREDYAARYREAYGPDDVTIEYKSLQLGLRGGARYSPGHRQLRQPGVRSARAEFARELSGHAPAQRLGAVAGGPAPW